MNIRRCIVKGCPVKSGEDTKIFRFPVKEPELMAIWCNNIGVPQENVLTSSRICARHFETSYIGLMRLKQGAVPTLHLGNNDQNIKLLKPVAKAKRILLRTCIVNGCGSNSILTCMYSFPVDEKRRQVWIEACNLEEESTRIKHLFICGKHFEQEFVRPTCLNKAAIPIIYNDKYKNADIVYENDVVYEPDVFKGSVAFKDPDSDYACELNAANNFNVANDTEVFYDSDISYEFDVVSAPEDDTNPLIESDSNFVSNSDNDKDTEIYNKFVTGNESNDANDNCDNDSYDGYDPVGFDNISDKTKVCKHCRKNRKLTCYLKKRLINVQKDLKNLKLKMKRLKAKRRWNRK